MVDELELGYSHPPFRCERLATLTKRIVKVLR